MLPKKLLKLTGLSVAVVVSVIVVILGSNYLSHFGTASRSAESTEIHRVLGDPFIWQDEPGQPVTTIYHGTPFYVHNKYIRGETCHVVVTNLWTSPTMNIAHHHSMFSNWFNAGIYEFNEYFEIPDDLPDGQWDIIKKTVNYCGVNIFYTTNYDVLVTIAHRPIAAPASGGPPAPAPAVAAP